MQETVPRRRHQEQAGNGAPAPVLDDAACRGEHCVLVPDALHADGVYLVFEGAEIELLNGSRRDWKESDVGEYLTKLLDKRLRGVARRFYANPRNVFKRLYYQSVMIIQPIDMLDDGRQNMCDSCPDVTVWNGKLVWSCRMDEQANYGCNLVSRPKAACGNGQASH